MLKSRLARLEQSIKQPQDEDRLYLVYRNEGKDRMCIPRLNFFGTVENGRMLMEQYPNSLFVIWSMATGADYDDEEWKNMVENFAR